MRIALPVTGGKVADSIESCEQLAVAEVDEANRTLESIHIRKAPAKPARWILRHQIDLVLATRLPSGQERKLMNSGVAVLTNAEDEPPEAVVEAFLAGRLPKGG
jgi:predicted Fe-Mo cluster-binding NifX family protein